ncbi:MAG: SURF1 family protein [Methylococcales bacterium]
MRHKSLLLPLIAYLAVFTLLINLGFWQLDRAAQKRLRLSQQLSATDKAPIRITDQITAITDYGLFRKVSVSGAFDGRQQFLIDNQIKNSQPGYFVLTPFIISGQKKAVLVNRGWIKANPLRTQLPDIPITNPKGTITGTLNRFPSVAIHLAGADIPTATNPSVVQVVNANVLSEKLNYPLHDFQVQLAPEIREGFLRDWDTAEKKLMPPEKHEAYALQWFAMALVLTLICFRIFLKKKTNE